MKIFKGTVIFGYCLILLTEAKASKNNGGVIWNFLFGDKAFTNNINNYVEYIHWGRKDCTPNSSEIVYVGYLGGGHFTQTGAGTNPLCLPEKPEYDEQMVANGSHRAEVYGAEYETKFNQYPQWSDVYETDPACAVCLAKGRSASIMIPAKRTCPEGWTKEYGGLLMGGFTDHVAAHEYLCVDGSPQSRDDSKTNKNGFVIYPAIGKCGSLKCPPYVDNHELSCVVCTR